MKYFGDELGGLHKEMGSIIRKKGRFEEARLMFFRLHSQLHSGSVYGLGETEYDLLLSGLSDDDFRLRPQKDEDTIIWNLWHIARIEDITAGFLLSGEGQLFSPEIKEKMHSPIADTGNAMTEDEVTAFSQSISVPRLLRYRDDVGKRTREIISQLSESDMKRKFTAEHRERILMSGSVVSHPESEWLADFWTQKDAAGIILMPLTRHQLLHLNQCGKIKSELTHQTKK